QREIAYCPHEKRGRDYLHLEIKLETMKVIERKNLPTKIPVINTLVIVMALDFYNSSAWLWGVLLTIWSIIVIASIIGVYRDEYVDLFEDDDDDVKITTKKTKSSFQQKMEDMIDKNHKNHTNR